MMLQFSFVKRSANFARLFSNGLFLSVLKEAYLEKVGLRELQ